MRKRQICQQNVETKERLKQKNVLFLKTKSIDSVDFVSTDYQSSIKAVFTPSVNTSVYALELVWIPFSSITAGAWCVVQVRIDVV